VKRIRIEIRLDLNDEVELQTYNNMQAIASRLGQGATVQQAIKELVILFSPAAMATHYMDVARLQKEITDRLVTGELAGYSPPVSQATVTSFENDLPPLRF
jgi:hypothetical protein